MSQLQIGVALCAYNGAKYIREQLDSIAGQMRLPDMLVVVDDRSTDNTVEIVQAFAEKAPFPVALIINDINLGYIKNFEKAITLCECEIIALSDQDDIWYPEKLQVIEKAFIDHPDVGMVFSDAEIVGEALHPYGYRLWQTLDFTRAKQNRVGNGKAFGQLLKRNVVTGAAMAFKREYLPSILPIPTSWVHDGWIALLVACQGKILPISQPLIRYRQHGGNQIGARRRTITEKLAIARQKKHEYYQADVLRALDAADRIRRIFGKSDRRLAVLEKKIMHSKVRASLPDQQAARLLPIIRELACFHYSRYANGLKSAIRDFVV